MEVIKKAYLQEVDCEDGMVSPREVGHNIYILGLQVQIYMDGIMEWNTALLSVCVAGFLWPVEL